MEDAEMKKIIIFMALALLVFACGNENGNGPDDNRYECTVTFQRLDVDIAQEVMTTVKVKEGEKVKVPSGNTAKTGEAFLGWFSALQTNNNYINDIWDRGRIPLAAVPYDFEQPVTKDITIYGRSSTQKKIIAGNDLGFASGVSILKENLMYTYCSPNGSIFIIYFGSGESWELGTNITIYKPIEYMQKFEFEGKEYVIGYNYVSTYYFSDYRVATSNSGYFEMRNNNGRGGTNYSDDLSPEQQLLFCQQLGIDRVRIRDISRQAVYIAGGTFWEEGYYYRIESWGEQYLASLEE
jgi:hypothetical protein